MKRETGLPVKYYVEIYKKIKLHFRQDEISVVKFAIGKKK